MPSYDYRCEKCGKFTVYQGIKEPALTACPTCNSPVYRIIGGNVNVVFKGTGFYSTDYPSYTEKQLTDTMKKIDGAKAEAEAQAKAAVSKAAGQ